MQQKVAKQSGPRLVGGGTGNGSGKQGHRVATCGNTQPTKSQEPPLIDTEEFRMFAYKVLDCQKKYRHDWSACPYAHQGEKAKRRDPRRFQYVAMVCLDMKTTGHCARGDACPFCHNVFELWLHPARYRTQLCNNGATCDRKVCFFAHSLDQLRTTPGQFVNEKVEQFLGNSIMANPEVMKAIFSLEQSAGGVNPQVDKETTAKLASLQQQLLGSEKLFQEILNYNKADLDIAANMNTNVHANVGSKPYMSDQTQTPMCNQASAPAPPTPTLTQNQPTCFLTNNSAPSHLPPTDPLMQLLAITQQKPVRFSAESFNSPLDFQTSPQSPQRRSASDLFAQVSRCDGGLCGTIPEAGALFGLSESCNNNNSSDLSSCFDGGNSWNCSPTDVSDAAAAALFRAKSMYTGSPNAQIINNNYVDAVSLQQFINALNVVGTATGTATSTPPIPPAPATAPAGISATTLNKPRTLCHQDSADSGSSFSSNNSIDRRNLLGVTGIGSHPQNYNTAGFPADVYSKYQSQLSNCSQVSSPISFGSFGGVGMEEGCIGGGGNMNRGLSGGSLHKFSSFPQRNSSSSNSNTNCNYFTAVEDKKLLECVEFLHLFEDQANNDAVETTTIPPPTPISTPAL